VDKLLAGAEMNGIDPVICISKKDLVTEDELQKYIDIYSDIYPVTAVNGNTGEGIQELYDAIRGRSAALAGPSGVGKSTITNHILGDDAAEVATGDISSKTRRGRHTTRHVEIFPLGDGTYLYDTPGFTSLDMPGVDVQIVRELFPEFREPGLLCRYSDCMHINEPDCGVKQALAEGKISRSRYDSYLMMTEEVKKWHRL
jgi:ribosome biogenesis GTPase